MNVGRYNMAWTMVKNRDVYATGGLRLKSVERYDIQKDHWEILEEAEMLESRMSHACCTV